MITTQDAKQRWERAVIRAEGTLLYVTDIHEVTRAGVVSLSAVTPNEKLAWDTVNTKVPFKSIDESFPELGNIPYHGNCMYLTRKASHQFRRGYVPGQIEVEPVIKYKYMIPKISGALIAKHQLDTPEAGSPAVIQAVYNPEYVPMMEAVRRVRSGHYMAVPFSRQLSIGAFTSRWPVVFYKILPIGKVKGDNVILFSKAAQFRELVQERSPLPVIVGE